MADTTRERYAVVSCHVERPLDDEVWERFSFVQRTRPGGFRIAALIRPPDPDVREDEELWLERARVAVERGPLGHHTHWTAPDHARPTDGETGARVLAEGSRLRELGLRPTLFCGGGWYTDADVADACAELGYVDCTPRSTRPSYLPEDAPWAQLETPATLRLPTDRRLLSIPTTHSLGDLARALRARRLPELVHVYFHDTDLRSRGRRALVALLLPLLARRTHPADLDTFAAQIGGSAREAAWADVARL